MNRRNSYRVVYPIRERPALLSGGVSVPVLDCSERGIRLWASPGLGRVRCGDLLRGHIRFRDGREYEVTGTVVRIGVEELGMRLQGSGLPLAVLFDEQRYLRVHYPGWDATCARTATQAPALASRRRAS